MIDDSPSERSFEEREQARRERAARRAERHRTALSPGTPATEPGEPPPSGVNSRNPAASRALPPEPSAPARGDPQEPEPAAPPTERAGSSPPGRPPRSRGRSGAGGIGLRLALALALLLALGAAGAFAVTLLDSGGGGQRVSVEVPRGAGVTAIGDLLEARGVVGSGRLFELRATLGGRRGELRPGTYQLERDMGYGAAIDALAAGPPPKRVQTVDVTIPEGRSRREIAPVVSKAGLSGSYRRATVRSSELRPRRYGAGRARDLEGFLFPATYEVRRAAGTRGLVGRQLQAFEREFGQLDLRRARRRNLTPYDVITIASMVEREAQVPRERPLIASVIYNRLRQGIPLGIDATVRFATGNWTRPLRESELAIDSGYNTRTRAGLPPGPIGNPGRASLRAAALPARTDFLYYVVKPGSCGEHEFSATAAQFERDVSRYNAERERRGGRSPTNC